MKLILLFVSFYFMLNTQAFSQTEKITHKNNMSQEMLDQDDTFYDSNEMSQEMSYQNDASNDLQDNYIEKIKITGSHVQRIDTEGPSPIVIYDKEDLENSGYSSAGDFIRDTTISHFGVMREEAGSSASGESTASIKGQATLILINGQKIIEDPSIEAVDLNLIPIYAIQRVEVLKDAASAVYGSDAVGGVINFITKSNFSGLEFHGQITPTIQKGGSRVDFATVFGMNDEDVSLTGSLQFRFQDAVLNKDRSWTKKVISSVGPYPTFYKMDNKKMIVEIDPSCPENSKTDSACEYNVAYQSSRSPKYMQTSLYLNANANISESKLYAQFIANYKYNSWFYAPIPAGINIPKNHNMSKFTGYGGQLLYRFIDAGSRVNLTKSLTKDLTVGMKGYLSSTWDYDFNLKLANISKNSTQENLLLKKEILQAIVTGIYDPYDKSKRNLSKAKYTAHGVHSSYLTLSSLNLSGELFWDINMATGLQAYYKSFRITQDKNAKNILSNAGGNSFGKRYVLSHYVELVKPFSNILEIQLALREDYYSDFKWTTNPKAAFRLQALPGLSFRGSIGTAFIAPALSSMYAVSAEGYPTIFDTVACYNKLTSGTNLDSIYQALGNYKTQKEKQIIVKKFLIDQRSTLKHKNITKSVKKQFIKLSKNLNDIDHCKEKQKRAHFKGNKKLKETTSLVASIGSVVQLAKDHSFTIDSWYVKNQGVASSGLNKKTMDAELKLSAEHVKKYGIIINRDKNEFKTLSQTDFAIKSKPLNLGISHITGLDFNWQSYFKSFNLFGGHLYFTLHTSYMLFSKSKAFPGLEYVNSLGEYGLPAWRMAKTIGWKTQKHNLSISSHATGSVYKASSLTEKLPRYTRFDIDYQFVFNSKSALKLGWSNVLLSTPPIDDGLDNGKLNQNLFENKGPSFFVGFKQAI